LDSTSLSAEVANDSNSDGVTWSLTGPGTLSNKTSTSVTYTASAGQVGTDTFSYILDDGRGGTDSALVTVTIPSPVTVSGVEPWVLRATKPGEKSPVPV